MRVIALSARILETPNTYFPALKFSTLAAFVN